MPTKEDTATVPHLHVVQDLPAERDEEIGPFVGPDTVFPNGWDLLHTPWSQPDLDPATRAMLADSYDEHDRLVCLDHGTAGCVPCGLVAP